MFPRDKIRDYQRDRGYIIFWCQRAKQAFLLPLHQACWTFILYGQFLDRDKELSLPWPEKECLSLFRCYILNAWNSAWNTEDAQSMFGKEMKERMKWGHWLEGKESEQGLLSGSQGLPIRARQPQCVCVCWGGQVDGWGCEGSGRSTLRMESEHRFTESRERHGRMAGGDTRLTGARDSQTLALNVFRTSE